MLASVQSIRLAALQSRPHFRQLHQQSYAAAPGFLNKLFGSKTKKTEGDSAASAESKGSESPAELKDTEAPTEPAEVANAINDDFEYDERKPLTLKFPKRQYSARRLEQRLRMVLKESEVTMATPDWKDTKIADKETKLKVLSKVIKNMKVPVPNRVLNNVNTAGDLFSELSAKPLEKDAGHPVAEFYAKKASELPENMKFEPFAKGTRKLHAHQ
ncbi:hypothetical protein IWW36_000884 [Coemansia brasiliensis]|uniref:Uncharacterized protein n=1 Tax=Coemansia brasiliensis TaxID=2650707 RepID=A0A9W8IHV0_9FUNG|nr:hypothetical protein IWW36_000884 [Coemansia brasiliensis]